MALSEFFNKSRLNQALSENKQLKDELSAASNFVEALKSADLQATYSGRDENSALGESLLSLRSRMIALSKEEEQRNWVNQGLAKFADLLRVTKQENAASIFDQVISSLVAYLGINQGAIFLINDDRPNDQFIELVSCYAYQRKKYLNRRIELGDGLVGQCFLEKQIIYMTDVPPDYIQITSGLGEALPRCVLLVPMMLDEQVLGVTELASFKTFDKYQIDFVSRIAENMASTFAGARTTMRTQTLLKESQFQAEQLRTQEEEMRQNMEELTATQEEMQRKAHEVLKATAEMSSILNGIDATMATIDFTPEGYVTTANALFLKSMKYTLADIKGKHHRMFVPLDIAESQEYAYFWKNLAAGKSNTDLFRRIDATGKTIWLNAIYNPILDPDGNVLKVIKFSTDMTSQKEKEMEVKNLLEESKAQEEELRQTMEEITATQEEMVRKNTEIQQASAELESLMNGLNNTMATVEFALDGTVITANSNFLAVMNYSLEQIKGKHHRLFVPEEIRQGEEYQRFWRRLVQGHAVADVFKRTNSEGEEVWLNAIYNPIFNSKGDVLRVMKMATDITKDKRREADLDRAKTLLSLISKTTTEGLWDMDVPADMQFNDDTPFNWYERFRQLLGFDSVESFPNILSSWSDRLHPDHKQQTLDAFAKHLQDYSGKTPYDVEYQLRLKDGSYKWFRAVGNTLRDTKGFPKRVAGSLIDIQHFKESDKTKEGKKIPLM